MPGDDKWLTVGKAAQALGSVHPETVRRYINDDLLYAYRMAKGHRRVSEGSVQRLAEVLRMPDGIERQGALDALRRQNKETRQRPGRGPTGSTSPE